MYGTNTDSILSDIIVGIFKRALAVWKFPDHGNYSEDRESELKADRYQVNEGSLSRRY